MPTTSPAATATSKNAPFLRAYPRTRSTEVGGGGPWRRAFSALHHSANAGSRSSASPRRTTIPPAIACCSSGLARGASISLRIPGEASTLDVAYSAELGVARTLEGLRGYRLLGSTLKESLVSGSSRVLVLAPSKATPCGSPPRRRNGRVP